MIHTYNTTGTCAKTIQFDVTEGRVYSVKFLGGCNGNLKAIAKLVDGKNVEEVIETLDGITCGNKATSCTDQFAKALKEVL